MKVFLLLGATILMLCSSSCNNRSSITSTPQEDSIEVIYDTPYYSNYKANKYQEAISAAQSVIKSQFDDRAYFIEDGLIIDETQVSDRYKILQKFSSNKFNKGEVFIYRIFIQKFGENDWDFGALDIEDSQTSKNVLHVKGGMKDRETKTSGSLKVAGITFAIAEEKPKMIRIYTSQKLPRSKVKEVISELNDSYSTIQFATDAKHQRGDEYCVWISGTFIDMDKNEVIERNKFLK